MSGGRFDHRQYILMDIAEEIQHVIDTNDDASINEWGDRRGRGYSPEVIAKLHEAVQALKVAYVYAQRADWLLSDDDGEESFLERLEEELSGMNKHRCAKCGAEVEEFEPQLGTAPICPKCWELLVEGTYGKAGGSE